MSPEVDTYHYGIALGALIGMIDCLYQHIKSFGGPDGGFNICTKFDKPSIPNPKKKIPYCFANLYGANDDFYIIYIEIFIGQIKISSR